MSFCVDEFVRNKSFGFHFGFGFGFGFRFFVVPLHANEK